MRARLVQIGNSRGIRLPKPLIEEAGLGEDVELTMREGGILILPAQRVPRAGWADAGQRMREVEGDGLVDPATMTRFDDQGWEW